MCLGLSITDTHAEKIADVDWSRIADKTVAVIGYGSQGRAQAANLRDSGLAVIVGVRPGRSFEAASLDGFTTMPVADAVRKADVLAMLVPDESAAEIFRRDMLPWLHDGQTITARSYLRRMWMS